MVSSSRKPVGLQYYAINISHVAINKRKIATKKSIIPVVPLLFMHLSINSIK